MTCADINRDGPKIVYIGLGWDSVTHLEKLPTISPGPGSRDEVYLDTSTTHSG